MKHLWQNVDKRPVDLMSPRKRRCQRCKATQAFTVISYDRIDGTRRAWRPLVGRCAPSVGQRNEKALADQVE